MIKDNKTLDGFVVETRGKSSRKKITKVCDDCAKETITDIKTLFQQRKLNKTEKDYCVMCCQKYKHNSKFNKLIGKRFGKLLITEYIKRDYIQHTIGLVSRHFYKALCDCGKEIVVDNGSLRYKNDTMRSCGCFIFENINKVRQDRLQRFGTNDSAINELFSSYKRGALKRRIEFCLSKKDFISFIFNNCFYCDKVPSNKFINKRCTLLYSGIDRVDNSKGYILNNCVTCCIECNQLKRYISFNMIEKIYKFIKNNE